MSARYINWGDLVMSDMVLLVIVFQLFLILWELR